MAHEIETKVLDIDVAEILEKMAQIWAKKVLETQLSVSWYHFRGVKRGEDLWFLRIRSDSDGTHEDCLTS